MPEVLVSSATKPWRAGACAVLVSSATQATQPSWAGACAGRPPSRAAAVGTPQAAADALQAATAASGGAAAAAAAGLVAAAVQAADTALMPVGDSLLISTYTFLRPRCTCLLWHEATPQSMHMSALYTIRALVH